MEKQKTVTFELSDDIDLLNSLEDRLELNNYPINELRNVFGSMNNITDKTAGWFIEFSDGTAVEIYNYFMAAGNEVDHLGETEGIWEVRTNNMVMVEKHLQTQLSTLAIRVAQLKELAKNANF